METNNEINFDESVDFVVTWNWMESLKSCGLVKSIGVCNFNVNQLFRIISETSTPPAVNQVSSASVVLTTFSAFHCRLNVILFWINGNCIIFAGREVFISLRIVRSVTFIDIGRKLISPNHTHLKTYETFARSTENPLFRYCWGINYS